MANSKEKWKFARVNEKYPLAEKKGTWELIVKYKEDYDRELKNLESKTHYDYKRKKHLPMKLKQGFLATALREFYTDLSKVNHDDSNLVKALKFERPLK